MPVNIIRFERLAYVSFATSMLAYALGHSMILGTRLVLWVAISGVLYIALILATARLRKDWLRGGFAGFIVCGVAGDAWAILDHIRRP
jgi:hypothetical protein